MFKEERTEPKFEWSMIGDLVAGRPNLGSTMDVAVYRLMQFTLRDVLIIEYGPAVADKIFFKSGAVAGKEFCKAMHFKDYNFNEFIAKLQQTLKDLKIGILRIEKADMENMRFTMTVAEDLDCSGLPVVDETICTYDEGFISGLLTEYAGTPFTAKEIDCWCSGERVCRFDVGPSI